MGSSKLMHRLAYLGMINIDRYTSPIQPLHEQLKHRSNLAVQLNNAIFAQLLQRWPMIICSDLAPNANVT